MSQRY